MDRIVRLANTVLFIQSAAGKVDHDTTHKLPSRLQRQRHSHTQTKAEPMPSTPVHSSSSGRVACMRRAATHSRSPHAHASVPAWPPSAVGGQTTLHDHTAPGRTLHGRHAALMLMPHATPRPLPPPLGTAALERAALELLRLPQLPMQPRDGRRRSRRSSVEGSCRRCKRPRRQQLKPCPPPFPPPLLPLPVDLRDEDAQRLRLPLHVRDHGVVLRTGRTHHQ